MHWIYIIKCEDGYFYIGETKRLCRRFNEHTGGRGGVNTSTFEPENIVSIYKISNICKFIEYNNNVINTINNNDEYNWRLLENFNEECEYEHIDNLEAENNITERMMIHYGEKWEKIRGGKYTRFNTNRTTCPDNDNIKNLPMCYCYLPCDIKHNEDKNYLYFRCSKKNLWEKIIDEFGMDDSDPCNFYQEYILDKELKLNEIKRKEDCTILLKELFYKSKWLTNKLLEKFDVPCLGGCGNFIFTKIKYRNIEKNLCYDCFISENKQLEERYTVVKQNIFNMFYKNIKK